MISREEFEVLNQDTTDVDCLAAAVLSLAERIVTPRTVFPIMPSEYRDVYASYQQVCTPHFEVKGTADSETTERIIPRILEGIRRSAFLIADVSERKDGLRLRVFTSADIP